MWGQGAYQAKRQKKRTNFLAPTQNPHLGPQKIVYVPHFLAKNAKKGTRINLFGGFLGSKIGSHTGHFRPQKVYLLFFFCLYKSEDSQTGGRAPSLRNSPGLLVGVSLGNFCGDFWGKCWSFPFLVVLAKFHLPGTQRTRPY